MATEINTTATSQGAKPVYNADNGGTPDAPPKKKLNKRFLVVLTILIIGGGAFGITKYLHAQHHEETDDAQIDANISPVIPRISGYVGEIRVQDNQQVKKGDTLMILDNRDYKIKLDQAVAAVGAAEGSLSVTEATTTASEANIATTQANVATANAQIEAAKVNVWRATQDFNRYANLIKDHTITQQQYEQAEAAKQTAERQLSVLQAQRNAAASQSTAASSQRNATARNTGVANATIRQRQAEVENAKLALTYTVITAPENGRVSKVNVQSGQFVQAGQSLFAVVVDNSFWVVANFKETQLNKMHEGQVAEVSVDAFGGHVFTGKITSFSPATGTKFSLLPPDNASGNFVKVVQRLPVKIEFTESKDPLLARLRPGMNVNVDVHIN